MSERGTTCEEYGHHWINSTVDNYQFCDRDDCTLIRRYINDKWKIETPVKRKKRVKPVQESLWLQKEG